MERRTLIKGLGAAAAAGAIGTAAMTSGVAASGLNVTANNVSLTNDDGSVKEVSIDPDLTIDWSNFDAAVGAVSIFIEASVDGEGPNGGYYPIQRSEPALLPGSHAGMDIPTPGTSGTLELGPISALDTNRADVTLGWDSARTGDGDLRIVDAEHGAPDYASATETLNGKDISGAGAGEDYLEGANVWGDTIPADAGELVNGEYGAASDEVAFEADEGESATTTVDLRYTVQFLELGLNHFEAITGYDIVGDTDGTIGGVRSRLEELYDHTTGEWASHMTNSEWLSDVEPDDITVIAVTDAGEYTTDPSEPITWEVNQKRPVMTGEGEEYTATPGLTSRHAADMRGWDDGNTPVVLSQELSFDVTVTNEASGSGSTGDTNTAAN